MRALAAALALVPAIAAGSVTGNYQPGFGCPGRSCVDRLEVSLNAPRGAGAVFVAIVPIRDGKPTLPGAWFTGPATLSVSPRPLAALSGEIGPYRGRFTIPGGACAIAAANGVGGTFGIYAGYGLAPSDLVDQLDRLKRRVAEAMPEAKAKAEAAMQRVAALNPVATAGGQNMLAQGTFWPIATFTCGDVR